VYCRIETVAYRDKLDLDKPADRVAAQMKVFTEDPDLYKRYRAANTARVGTLSVMDLNGLPEGPTVPHRGCPRGELGGGGGDVNEQHAGRF
jgi:hypothetical protein